MSSTRIDMTGQRYGSLTALSFSHYSKGNAAHWLCRCDCGTTRTFEGCSLRRKDTISCGCVSRQRTLKRWFVHGGTGTPTYSVWRAMIKRCTNPIDKSYKHYGGRGIRVCERWHRFENFLADMGQRSPGMSLDRINNDGNYEPENCRWATKIQQARNTRKTRLVTFRGESKCLSAWAEDIRINYGTLISRINNSGWTIEKAFTTPVGPVHGKRPTLSKDFNGSNRN